MALLSGDVQEVTATMIPMIHAIVFISFCLLRVLIGPVSLHNKGTQPAGSPLQIAPNAPASTPGKNIPGVNILIKSNCKKPGVHDPVIPHDRFSSLRPAQGN